MRIGVLFRYNKLIYLMEMETETDFVLIAVPPFLRYGKYCGILYSGCPGEKPCDGLDACCMKHDACVQAHNSKQVYFGFHNLKWMLLV